MLGRGTLILTQGGLVPVEDIDEGHRFSLQTDPPHGVCLRRLGEAVLVIEPRTLVLLEDGRDLVLNPMLRLRTPQGFIEVQALHPGTLVLGPRRGVISHVEPCDPGAMYHFDTLENLVFILDGVEAQSGKYTREVAK